MRLTGLASFNRHAQPGGRTVSRFSTRRALASVLALLFLLGFSPQSVLAQNQGKVHGLVTYEKIPVRDPDTRECGLQIKKSRFVPVIGAKVDLVTEGARLLGTTFTDAHGAYAIPWSVEEKTTVRVIVWASSAHVKVQNFGRDKSLHSISAFPLAIFKGDVQQDLKATDEGKNAGAFNILEAIRLADEFLEKAQPGISKEINKKKITVVWTAGVYPDGTSRFLWGTNLAFIKGNRDFNPNALDPAAREGDCDEFDDHIIIHEYGHFLMKNFSRDDSPGGSHHTKVDARVAWSEGWAHFFACAVLDDPHYVDSGRNEKGEDICRDRLDLDEKVDPKIGAPGYWNEHTVASTLWALFDKRLAPPEDVRVGLGFQPIWEVVSGPLKAPRHVTLIDFCDLLVEKNPHLARKVAEVLENRQIKFVPGKVPSVEPAFRRTLQFGQEYQGSVNNSGKRFDRRREAWVFTHWGFESSQFYEFEVKDRTRVKIQMKITGSTEPALAKLKLYLHDAEREIAANPVVGVGNSATISRVLEPGRYYIQVQSYAGVGTARYTLQGTVVEEK